MSSGVPCLTILAGLPGTGKTAIARRLAVALPAVYLRVDSIEQAIVAARAGARPINDAGYRVAYALAEDNLRLGNSVVADSVNPIPLTRNAWLNVAHRSGATPLEVEVVCSDAVEHRRRVESRTPDIEGLKLPTWQEVINREYEPWQTAKLVLDTASLSLEECIDRIRALLQ